MKTKHQLQMENDRLSIYKSTEEYLEKQKKKLFKLYSSKELLDELMRRKILSIDWEKRGLKYKLRNAVEGEGK